MMELVSCQRCGTEILPATAEATGGYCRTCAKPVAEKVLCQRCDTEILRATADATGGYCMICAQEWAPKVVEEMERRRKPYNFKITPGEWIKNFLLLLTVGALFMMVTTVVKIALGILAVLIAVYLFGVSWPNAIMFVTLTYLAIRLVYATLEVLDFKPKRLAKSRREKD